MVEKPYIIIGNKMDTKESKNNLDVFMKKIKKDEEVIPISTFDISSLTMLSHRLYQKFVEIEQFQQTK